MSCLIRQARPEDLASIAPFFRAIVAAGETYAYPEDLDDAGIARLWMAGPPGRCVVAVDDGGAVLGSATMGPNRPGRGAHIATASFMVDPAAQGRGVGRALGNEVLRWASAEGYHGGSGQRPLRPRCLALIVDMPGHASVGSRG